MDNKLVKQARELFKSGEIQDLYILLNANRDNTYIKGLVGELCAACLVQKANPNYSFYRVDKDDGEDFDLVSFDDKGKPVNIDEDKNYALTTRLTDADVNERILPKYPDDKRIAKRFILFGGDPQEKRNARYKLRKNHIKFVSFARQQTPEDLAKLMLGDFTGYGEMLRLLGLSGYSYPCITLIDLSILYAITDLLDIGFDAECRVNDKFKVSDKQNLVIEAGLKSGISFFSAPAYLRVLCFCPNFQSTTSFSQESEDLSKHSLADRMEVDDMSISELEDDIRVLRRKQTKARSLEEMKQYNREIIKLQKELNEKMSKKGGLNGQQKCV